MSSQNFKINSSKDLFSVEDDVEDETFLRHSQSGPSGYIFSDKCSANSHSSSRNMSSPQMTLEERTQQLIDQRKAIEKSSLMSTQRSLSYLRNSEEVGIAAAEELLKQREQLERTERSLDNINSTLRFSQKHIQGIRSVFGGLKNLFGSKPSETIPGNAPTEYNGPLSSKVAAAHQKTNNSMDNHIGLRIRGLVDESSDVPGPEEHEKRINQNLDQMLGSITKLKDLAHGLGDEIQSHNVLIENVIDKTEKADISLGRQNKAMKKLLK